MEFKVVFADSSLTVDQAERILKFLEKDGE